MKKSIILLLSLGIIVILIIGGYFMFFNKFTNKTNDRSIDSEAEEKNISQNIPAIEEKKVIERASDLALPLSDLPSGWEISTRGERTKTDVSENGLSLGWKEGYEITFRKTESKDVVLSQIISVYPAENISIVLEDKKEFIKKYDLVLAGGVRKYWLDEFGTKQYINALGSLDIGNDSIAYKYTSESGALIYYIEFVKDKYYVAFSGYDYELMKELARKVEAKIP